VISFMNGQDIARGWGLVLSMARKKPPTFSLGKLHMKEAPFFASNAARSLSVRLVLEDPWREGGDTKSKSIPDTRI